MRVRVHTPQEGPLVNALYVDSWYNGEAYAPAPGSGSAAAAAASAAAAAASGGAGGLQRFQSSTIRRMCARAETMIDSVKRTAFQLT